MKKTLLLLFTLFSISGLQAQKNANGTNRFHRHEFSLSVFGAFLENRSPYDFNLNGMDLRHQWLNGIQYKYHFNQNNALRTGLTYFREKMVWKGGPETSPLQRAGIFAGYERQLGHGKWQPYVFGDLSYQYATRETRYMMDPYMNNSIIYAEPISVETKHRTHEMGINIGGGLKFYYSKHLFIGLELSTYVGLYQTRSSSNIGENYSNKGKVISFAPIRFLSVGISF